VAPSCKVACIQVNAQNDMAANIAALGQAVRDAAADGAELITTPENVTMMAAGGREIRERAATEDSHAGLAAFRELAAATGTWLLAGSLGIATPSGKVGNRSYLIEPSGAIAAAYDKIHMFDVELSGGETYRESANFEPGAEAVLAHTPWGPLGLTICYDVRFPHLYRALAHGGARLITVPSAFTRPTGEAHWHVLLRARAIETGAFIIAPAQTGTHPRGRQTYGHSLIVSPWGEVMADGGDQPGVVTAVLDLGQVDRVRASVPSLDHDRTFAAPPPARADIKGAA
jgi:predicted amidohydrolase